MENINSLKLARKPVSTGTSRLEVPFFIDKDALPAFFDYACKLLQREKRRAEKRARSGRAINHSDLNFARYIERVVADMWGAELTRAQDGDV